MTWHGFSSLFPEDATRPVKKKAAQLKSKGNSDFNAAAEKGGFIIRWVGKSYLTGLVFVELWGLFLHPFFLGDKLPFLPLMLISVYCALGIMYSWIWQLRSIIRSS